MKTTKTRLTLNQLEAREVPATLVSPTRLTYRDIDGDNVTVTFSKPILNTGNVGSIFTFAPAGIGSNLQPQQLRSINLSSLATAAGTTITTDAVRSAVNGGDGFAALGQIDATGRDLSTVTIDGDLGRIRAGDANTATQALGTLSVHSMGRFGTSTGATDLLSQINGSVSALRSKSDIKEVLFSVIGGVAGKIGSVTIGGSLIGGAADTSGYIFASGDIGALRILGDLEGNVGTQSGSVSANGKLASVFVGGSMIGSAGSSSGQILSIFNMGPVTVVRDVRGGSFNSPDFFSASGTIVSSGKLETIRKVSLIASPAV